MIQKLLLLIAISITLIAYIRIILTYLKTKNIKQDDITGFDLAKELTSNYDEINIVESKEITISNYNLKRKIIRFTQKDYTSNDIFTLTKTSLLGGYSILNLNKDKNLQLLNKIFPSLDYLNKSSILALLISILTTKIADAKIAIIILILILIYQYLINEITNNSKEEIKDKLKKILTNKNYIILEKTQNIFTSLNKLSFIVTLILLLRTVLIIID